MYSYNVLQASGAWFIIKILTSLGIPILEKKTNVFSPEWEVPGWHPYTCIFKPCPRDNVDLRIHSTHLNCSLYSKQEPTCNTIDSKCSSCKETWYVSNIRPADQKPLTRRTSVQEPSQYEQKAIALELGLFSIYHLRSCQQKVSTNESRRYIYNVFPH